MQPESRLDEVAVAEDKAQERSMTREEFRAWQLQQQEKRRAQQPAEAQPQDEGEVSTVGDVGQGLVKGVREAADETLGTLHDAGTWVENTFVRDPAASIAHFMDAELPDWLKPKGYISDYQKETGQKVDFLPQVDEPVTTAGQVTKSLSQFVTGFVGTGKVTKTLGWGKEGLTTAGRFLKSTVDSAATSAIAFDPYEERLSNLLSDNDGFELPLAEYLAADKDDSIGEARLKAAVEDVVLGVAGEAVMTVAKPMVSWMKGFKKYKNATEAGDEAGAAAAKAEMDEADAVLKDASEKSQAVEESIKTKTVELQNVTNKAMNGDLEAAERARVLADELKQIKENGDSLLKGEPKRTITVEGDQVKVKVEQPKGKPFMNIDRRSILKQFDELTDGQSPADMDNYDFFNLDHMVGEEDAFELLAKTTETFEEGLRKKVPAYVGFDDMEQHTRELLNIDDTADFLAKSTGMDEQSLMKMLQQGANDTNQLYAKMMAGRSMLVKANKDAWEAARALKQADSTENKAIFIEAMKKVVDVAGAVKGMQSNVARALASQRINISGMMADTSISRADLESMVNGQMDGKDLLKVAEQVADMNPKGSGIAQHAHLMEKRGKMEMFNELYAGSLLFRPSTLAINAISGAVETVFVPFERLMGGVLAKDTPAVKRFMADMVGNWQALGDAFKFAGKSIKNERNYLDPYQQKYDVAPYAIQARNVGAEDGTLLGGTVNLFGKLARSSFRILGGTDEFFKQLNYRSRVYSDAFIEMTGEGIDKANAKALAKQRVNEALSGGSAITKEGEALNADALLNARQTTFTEDLNYGVAQTMQRIKHDHPTMGLFLPFIRTPANLIRRAWQRTPVLGAFQKQTREMWEAGGVQRQQAIGRQVVGTMTYGAVLGLAMEGRLTGGHHPDRAQAERERQAGFKPYSVKIGDQWVSYKKLDPFGIPLAMVADLSAYANRATTVEAPVAQQIEDYTSGIMSAFAHIFTQKAYFTGLNNFFTLITDEGIGSEAKRVDAIKDIMQAVVAPAGVRTTGYIIGGTREMMADDRAMREVKGLWDKIKMDMGMTLEMPKKYNWLTGEPVVAPYSMNIGAPAYDDVTDPVMKELQELDVGLAKPQRTIGNVQLNDEQYSRLLQLTARPTKYMPTLKEQLGKWINSRTYQRTRPEVFDESKYQTIHAKKVQEIVSKYKQAAVRMLQKEYPELREAVLQDTKNQGYKYAGREDKILTDFIDAN